MSRSVDRIDVGKIDYAIGCLRGLVGCADELELSEIYVATVLQCIDHVRAAARLVERLQRPKRRRR